MILDSDVERMLLELLVSEGYLALLTIRLEHDEVVLLTHFEYIFDGLELDPRNIADMNKAVITVHADESAELADALDLAVDDDAGNDVRPEDLLSLFAFALDDDLLARYYTLLLVVDLETLETERFAHIRLEVADVSLFDLRRGDEYRVSTELAEKSAALFLGNVALDCSVDLEFEFLSVTDGVDDFVAFLDLVDGFFGETVYAVFRSARKKFDFELRIRGIIRRIVRTIQRGFLRGYKAVHFGIESYGDTLFVRGYYLDLHDFAAAQFAACFIGVDRLQELLIRCYGEVVVHVSNYLRYRLLGSRCAGDDPYLIVGIKFYCSQILCRTDKKSGTMFRTYLFQFQRVGTFGVSDDEYLIAHAR